MMEQKCFLNGNQKIANILNDFDNELSKFATKKWYAIRDQNDQKVTSIKFETKHIKSNLCDYSDAYIL